MRGFTVLEMVVSLAMTGIVLGIASPAINELRREYQLEGYARRISNEITAARMQAIAQNRTVRLRTTSLYKYVVEASDDGTNFTQVGGAVSLPSGMLLLQGSGGGPKFNRQGTATSTSYLYLVNSAGLQTIQTSRLGHVSRY